MNSIIPVRKREEALESSVARDINYPLEALHRGLHELFDSWDLDSPRWMTRRPVEHDLRDLSPSFDVIESADTVQVTAELPGMDEKDIEVTLDGHSLTVRGEKRQEKEDKKSTYHLLERSYGQFQRVVLLPHGIDRNKVRAKFSKGILDITIPKTAEAKEERKKISVNAA
ncbi:MAG: Hsp20/alpha crystallin family protein [Lentisphaerae bacterium]|nr:Hsp20/alpha crystallin family protein [Lentisphaerota bacterium]